MVTYSVKYTHADATTITFRCKNPRIIIKQPGKSIERQPNKIGKIVDPNQGYRFVKCNALLTRPEWLQLRAMLMPAAKPVYDATDPKVDFVLDGVTTETFLCAILGDVPAIKQKDKVMVFIEFTERSA